MAIGAGRAEVLRMVLRMGLNLSKSFWNEFSNVEDAWDTDLYGMELPLRLLQETAHPELPSLISHRR
jgi:hypothetical protein